MKFAVLPALGLAAAFALTATAQAATIAQWTFEASVPTTAGPHAAEIGSGFASGLHASASAVYSNPAGNGSLESFSSNFWSVGDYYQFKVGTLGLQDITVSFDQIGSSTGPRDFKLAYSTDGSSFTDFADYTVNNNSTPSWSSATPSTRLSDSFSFDLSAVTALDNRADVFFRLVQRSTVATGGGTVATAGTSRIDNVVIAGQPVPVPAAAWLFGSALAGLGVLRRRPAR